MSLNVSASSASPVPGFASSPELDSVKSAVESESSQDKAAMSLFRKDLQEAVGSKEDNRRSHFNVADQLAELDALLNDYLTQQEALAEEGFSNVGNEFPLSGSELPTIAVKIREFLDGFLAVKGLSQQSGELSSSVSGQGGVALLANGGLGAKQNAGQQLIAIANSLASLGEGAANNSDAARNLLGALSDTVKGLQQANELSNSPFTHLSSSLNGKANGFDLSLNPLASLGLSASGQAADRLSVESQQLAMTDLAVKDLSMTQGGLLAVTGNMRSGALQSAANVNASVNSLFNTQLELPLGNAQWGSQVLQRVAWLTGQGIAAAEIHLNPAELGPMQVRVDQRQDSATVVFTSHNSSTREAIEASLPRLRELFSEQGMELLDVDINSGEQEANANQQDDIDNLTSSQSDSNEILSTLALNEVALSDTKAETVVLRYGLIDAYA